VLKKGERIADAVERLRHRLGELKADVRRVRACPYPSSLAKQRAREQVEMLASAGGPNVSRAVDALAPVEFPIRQTRAMIRNVDTPAAVAFVEMPDALATMAWLLRDELIAKLDAAIDEASDDRIAMTQEQREKQELEISATMLRIEREIAALVWSGQAVGENVEHAVDCDARAVLGIELIGT
jgi:hypothetical protein